jgi:hypothetical protein
MTVSPDDRSPARKAADEAIAAEPLKPIPQLPPGTPLVPVEVLLARLQRPQAVVGIVENGMVRPLDPEAKLPERSRVIIVAAGSP